MRERILLLTIVALGAFLRLYHLPETLMFRGDQGRDAIVAKRILKDHDIALIGPVTSVGNMYLGPFYYYFMVPFLALTYPDPVGPAYGVALLSIATIALLYLVVKKFFGSTTALLSSFLLSIMTYAVQYGRFSWNPNIASFFAVLLLWSMLEWWQNQSYKQAILMWLWIGILAQCHYVSLITAGIVGLLMLMNLIYRKEYLKTVFEGLAGFGVFILTQLPLIIFDFRHNHIISKSFLGFFTSPEKHMEAASSLSPLNTLIGRANLVISQLFQVSQDERISWAFMGVGLLFAIIILTRMIKNIQFAFPFTVIFSWLLITIVGISFYSHSVFPHYLTFCYPIIAIFWAYIITTLWNQRVTLLIGVLLLGMLTWFNAGGLLRLGWSGQGTSVVQETVSELLPYVNQPYNIALLSDDKDYKGMIYRYFLEVSTKRPKETDDYGDLKSLAIIDEVNTIDPRSVPIYEIQTARDFALTHTLRANTIPHILILERE